MKKSVTALLSGLLLAAILCACSGTRVEPPATGVIIKSVMAGVPVATVSHKTPKSYLNMPEFQSILVHDWRHRYDEFSAALIEKATVSGLDVASLSEVLKAILATPESKGTALLPVAAYSSLYQGEEVWIISLRWECAGWSDASLGHVQCRYFTKKGIRQVGGGSCD